MNKPKSPDIQLSYLELHRLASYEVPLRHNWVIFNRKTREIARVVASCTGTALIWLKWNREDCDIVLQPGVHEIFGVKYCKLLKLRKDVSNTRK